MLVLNIFLSFLFVYLLFFNSYFFIFSLAGRLGKGSKAKSFQVKEHGKFMVLIPAYQEDEVILTTAKSASQHNYPKDKFDVFVIADKLESLTINKLRQIPVNVIEVQFEQSTKAKSINRALEVIEGDYDYVFILDVDNIMGKDCLLKVNSSLQQGFLAIQGHRTAKNKNTSFAILDGISEEINNNIFRKGHRALGLSSALIGSGMGFDYEYYRKRMFGIEEMGGEDREIELRILRDGNKIEYVEDAYILDEKVQNVKVFAKQRTRWLAGQFYFFKKHAKEGIVQLLKGNIDYFDKVLQTMIPPRVIMIGLLPIMAFLSYYFDLSPSYKYWVFVIVLMSSSMLLAIPNQMYKGDIWKALFQLPKAVIFMTLGMLNIGTAHQTNYRTPHTAHTPGAEEERIE